MTGNPSSVTHVYADGPNSYTVSATATDEDGTFAAGNTVGGYAVTERMLEMFKASGRKSAGPGPHG